MGRALRAPSSAALWVVVSEWRSSVTSVELIVVLLALGDSSGRCYAAGAASSRTGTRNLAKRFSSQELVSFIIMQSISEKCPTECLLFVFVAVLPPKSSHAPSPARGAWQAPTSGGSALVHHISSAASPWAALPCGMAASKQRASCAMFHKFFISSCNQIAGLDVDFVTVPGANLYMLI